MGSRLGRKRMNVEGDRLSSLPDDLIHKILSYVSIKHAVRTSVLSSRWRYIWTSVPVLSFSIKDFRMLPKFNKFVKHVLSGRNNQIEVSAVELTFRGNVSQTFFKRIMKYAFSHNVQELKVSCLPGKIRRSPSPAFSSTSLKTLTLNGSTNCLLFTNLSTWELPALTTLNLHYFALRDDKCGCLFSDWVNLKNLTLNNCVMMGGMNSFNICHPGLTTLTLEYNYSSGTSNLVTPQLKKLTVKNWLKINQIIAPELAFLQYEDGYYPLQLSTTDHLHLEKVDICIRGPSQDKETFYKIVSLLQHLHPVKFLTLNLEIVKLLSSFVELISHQPSPFVNLKSLKVYPAVDHVHGQPNITMSTEVKNYLLEGSPGATFTMVSYEEIRTMMNVAYALELLEDLQALLDRWKENSETNTAYMKPDKAPMESDMASIHALREVENHRAEPYIKNYWIDLNQQLKKESKYTDRIISMLQRIEEVQTRLPTSHRDKLKARFSGLCAEAETIVINTLDCMKIRFDMKSSRSNVYVHELSTSSHPAS